MRCVYAGTFDPPTYGHNWMVKKARDLFDDVHILIAINTDKKTMFPKEVIEEMWIEMIKEQIPQFQKQGDFGVFVKSTSGLVVDYAYQECCKYIVRGVRNATDYAYEQQIQMINKSLETEIETIFFIPPHELSIISSSYVKSMIEFKGWKERLKKAVHPGVIKRLERVLEGRKSLLL